MGAPSLQHLVLPADAGLHDLEAVRAPLACLLPHAADGAAGSLSAADSQASRLMLSLFLAVTRAAWQRTQRCFLGSPDCKHTQLHPLHASASAAFPASPHPPCGCPGVRSAS